jgi:hypothetical protein
LRGKSKRPDGTQTVGAFFVKKIGFRAQLLLRHWLSWEQNAN